MAQTDFWDTMKVLVGKDWQRTPKEDIQDWVDKVMPKKAPSVYEQEIEANTAWKRKMSDVSGKDWISDEEVIKFKKSLKLPKIDCKFAHPLIRLRLEKLMGTNICSLTDREYMTRLQIRILEDYAEKMDKRIKGREAEELERVKNLVLNGTIPLNEAPPEMADHPVMLIDVICNKLIAERRAKIKIPKVKIPTFLYWDDTPDPESGLTIQKGHVFRGPEERLCVAADKHLEYTGEDEAKYMMAQEDFDKIEYVDPLVKRLLECESVEEIYELAEEITGAKKLDTISAVSRVSGVTEDSVSIR